MKMTIVGEKEAVVCMSTYRQNYYYLQPERAAVYRHTVLR
jgi:hypothetical protein